MSSGAAGGSHSCLPSTSMGAEPQGARAFLPGRVRGLQNVPEPHGISDPIPSASRRQPKEVWGHLLPYYHASPGRSPNSAPNPAPRDRAPDPGAPTFIARASKAPSVGCPITAFFLMTALFAAQPACGGRRGF